MLLHPLKQLKRYVNLYATEHMVIVGVIIYCTNTLFDWPDSLHKGSSGIYAVVDGTDCFMREPQVFDPAINLINLITQV